MIGLKGRAACGVGVVALAAALSAAAAPPSADVSTAQPESLLVTGVYSPLALADSTAAVTVLNSDTIRALNKRSLADLLRTVPGLSVEEQGGAGGLTAVSIRGAESNFTLVLIDGVAVNDPTNSRGGSYDFAVLDPASVQRIEVVRGAQSAVYGSDALAGVINVITLPRSEGEQQELRVSAGEQGFYATRLAASGSADALRYSVAVASRDEGEASAGSRREAQSLSAQLMYTPDGRQQWQASYHFVDGERSSYPEQSGGPQYAASDALDLAEYRDHTLGLRWGFNISDHWRSELKFNHFEHDEQYLSPGISPYTAVPANGADTEFGRSFVQNLHTFSSGSWQWDVGADFRRERGDSSGFLDVGVVLPTDFALDRDTRSIFAAARTELWGVAQVQASLRLDDAKDFESETSAALGVRYLLRTDLSLIANWGQAFKLPSFFALGHALVGNPNLQPETATSWDVGASFSATETLQLQATYFSNSYRDMIDFDPALFTNINRRRVATSGAELQVDWSPLSIVQLAAQASYIDIDVIHSAAVLMERPQWKAGIYGLWQLAPNWHTALDYQWSAEQYGSSLYSTETVVRTISDYQRLDWQLRWQPRPTLELTLSLDNLFNEQYSTAVGFPASGRSLRLGISLVDFL